MKTTHVCIACVLALGFGCGDDDDGMMMMPGADSGMRDSGGGGDIDAGGGEVDAGGGDMDAGGGDMDAGGGGDMDAGGGGEDCDPMPTGTPASLIITQVIVDGDGNISVELYNPTDAAITPSGSDLTLCQFNGVSGAARYQSLSASETWEPGAFMVIEAPGWGVAGGEVGLYSSGTGFGNAANILDYVCWSADAEPRRKTTAETAGIWSGDCGAAIEAGDVIARNPSSAGTGAADYDFEATLADHSDCM